MEIYAGPMVGCNDLTYPLIVIRVIGHIKI